MSGANWTPDERRAWVSAYVASGQTQAEFCLANRDDGGPSERTLRAWVAAGTASPSDPHERQGALVRAARALALAAAEVQALLAPHRTFQPEQSAAGAGRRVPVAPAEPQSGPEATGCLAIDANPAMVAAVERCFREVCAGGLGLPLAAASHGDAEVPPPARKKNFFHDF